MKPKVMSSSVAEISHVQTTELHKMWFSRQSSRTSLNRNVRVVTCLLLGDSPSVRANNAPKSTHLQSKIFCAATPELVLFHTEISRNPTNLFSRVVNSSCELKLLAYKKYSHVDMSAGVLYFKTKIWMTTRLSCCFSMNSYARMFWIKKSTHWHTIRT